MSKDVFGKSLVSKSSVTSLSLLKYRCTGNFPKFFGKSDSETMLRVPPMLQLKKRKGICKSSRKTLLSGYITVKTFTKADPLIGLFHLWITYFL